MRIISILSVGLLGFVVPAQADVVQLTYGGQIEGDIVRQDSNAGVDIRSAQGHVFNIPWSNVSGVTRGNVVPPTPTQGWNDVRASEGYQPLIFDPVSEIGVPRAVSVSAPVALSPAPAYEVAQNAADYSYAPRLSTSRRPTLSGWGGNSASTGLGSALSIDGGVEHIAHTATLEAVEIDDTTIGDTAETAASNASLWGAIWSGRANFGASLQQGNTENNAIGADATLRAKWGDKHRASLKAEYNREEEDGDVTEDNRKLTGEYDYFFAPKWFANGLLSFEQDDIRNIDLRTQAGVGLGHQVFEGDDLNLQYTFGPTYLRTEFEDGDSEDDIAGRWALDYDQMVLDSLFQVFHAHEFLTPLDDTEAFLFDSKTGVRLPIRGGIVGTAQVDFDWDNAPEPGIKEDDTTYSLKIGYEW